MREERRETARELSNSYNGSLFSSVGKPLVKRVFLSSGHGELSEDSGKEYSLRAWTSQRVLETRFVEERGIFWTVWKDKEGSDQTGETVQGGA